MDWQPIDTAPRDGTFIDLWFPHNGESAATKRLMCRWREARDGTWAWFTQCGGRSFRMDNPSHWMPLPTGPESNGDRNNG